VVVPGLIVAAVTALHLAARLHYYGELLPNTYYAKVIYGWLTLGRGGRHLLHFLAAGGHVVIPGLLLLRHGPPLRAYLVHGYVLLAGYLLYLLLIGGDFPWWYRFYVPLVPLTLLGFAGLAAVAGDALLRASPTLRRGWISGRLRSLLAATLALALLSPTAIVWRRAEPLIAPVVRDTATNLQGLIVYFLRGLPRSSFVAASAVGMVGYYTELRILDAWGLNDRTIAHRRVVPSSQSVFAHDKTDWAYVLLQLPDFIFSYRAPNAEFPRFLHGYEACWFTYQVPYVLLYRRTFPLRPELRGLGMPPGMKRTLPLPPPCWPPGPRQPAAGR
jgi:arabinofuranosyltransferase